MLHHLEKVGQFILPSGFIVLDMEESPMPFIALAYHLRKTIYENC